MALFDWLKLKRNTPDLVARLHKAKTYDDMYRILDVIREENDVEMRNLEREISRIGEIEAFELGEARDTERDQRERRFSLLRIYRYRKQISAIEQRIDVYAKNTALIEGLIHKIKLMQAMQSTHIESREIDNLLIDFREKVEDYAEVLESGSTGDSLNVAPMFNQDERKELDSIAQEVGFQGSVISAKEVKPIGGLSREERQSLQKIEDELEVEIKDTEQLVTSLGADNEAEVEHEVDR